MAQPGLSRSGLVSQSVEDAATLREEDAAIAEEALAVLADPDTEWIPWEQARAEFGM